MNNQDVGFVLSNTPYKEYDAMILFLSKNHGLLRFVLRGYYKSTAKQTSLGLEFTQVILRFNYQKNRLLRIQSGELIDAYTQKREDFDWLMQMSLVSELLHRFYDETQHEFWYTEINHLFETINLERIIVFLSKIIKRLGITPQVDECVITGDSKVSDFSIEKAGFVSKAYRTQHSAVDLEMLQYIRVLFTRENINEAIFENTQNTQLLANLLIEYLEYYEGVKINSWKLMHKI